MVNGAVVWEETVSCEAFNIRFRLAQLISEKRKVRPTPSVV